MTMYYYYYDGLGSVVALTDSSGVKVRLLYTIRVGFAANVLTPEKSRFFTAIDSYPPARAILHSRSRFSFQNRER